MKFVAQRPWGNIGKHWRIHKRKFSDESQDLEIYLNEESFISETICRLVMCWRTPVHIILLNLTHDDRDEIVKYKLEP